MSQPSAKPCADCAPLFYDRGAHDGSLEAHLDDVRWHVEQAMAKACEVLPEGSAFALVNDHLWSEHRPAGALAPRRRRVTSALRKRILERDEHACVECGGTGELVIDHIVPVAKGGPTDEDNLRTLCADCNREKRDQ